MKFLRLDLRAFAHFSHKSIVFDPRKRFHLLWGANEAGKSTFTRAIDAVLFGMSDISRESFVHPPKNLCLEALIENKQGEILQVLRNSKLSRKLNTQLLDLVPHLDKEVFRGLFCINQESLKMGSKDLIQNIKRFDISLFTTICGTQNFLKVIKLIEDDTQNLYKPKGVKPCLNQKIAELKKLEEEKKSSLISYSKWEGLQNDKKNLQIQEQTLRNERQKILRQVDLLTSVTKNYQGICDNLQMAESLNSFEDQKILSKELLDRYVNFIEYVEEYEKNKIELNIERDRFVERQIPIKLQLEKYTKSLIAIPGWISVKNKLLDLSQKTNDSYEALKMLKSQISDLKLEIASLRSKLSSLSYSKNLSKQLQNFSKVESYYFKVLKVKELKELESQAFKNIKKKFLQNHNINLTTLLNFEIHHVRDYQDDFLPLLKEIEDFSLQLQSLAVEENEHLISLKSYKKKLGFDLESYQELKKSRKNLFKKLANSSWEPPELKNIQALFSKYQEVVDREDEQLNLFFSQVSKLAALELKQKNLENCRAKIDLFKTKKEGALALQKKIWNQIKKHVDPLNLFGSSVSLQDYEKILNFSDCVCDLKAQDLVLKNQKLEINDLGVYLDSVYGGGFTQKIIINKPTKIQQELESKEKLNTSWLNLHHQEQVMQTQVEALTIKNELEEKKYDQFVKQWGQLTSLLKVHIPPQPSEILNFLQTYESYHLLQGKINEIKAIINHKNEELSSRRSEVCQHAKIEYVEGESSFVITNILKKKVRCSLDYYSLKDNYQDSIRSLKLTCSLPLQLLLETFRQGFSFEEFKMKQKDAEKHLNDFDHQISSIHEALGALNYQENEWLHSEKVASIDQRLQQVQFELEDLVEELTVRKFSKLYLEKLSWDFQKQHQKELLFICESFFEKMTQGRYRKIHLNLLEKKESFLVCVDDRGHQITVDQLSEGTRDQLFLSLKLAFVKLSIKSRASFPLILDDILVNFDDQRAENCLSVLEEFSNETQVIFLTHHQHLVDLVKENISKEYLEMHLLKDTEQALV